MSVITVYKVRKLPCSGRRAASLIKGRISRVFLPLPESVRDELSALRRGECELGSMIPQLNLHPMVDPYRWFLMHLEPVILRVLEYAERPLLTPYTPVEVEVSRMSVYSSLLSMAYAVYRKGRIDASEWLHGLYVLSNAEVLVARALSEVVKTLCSGNCVVIWDGMNSVEEYLYAEFKDVGPHVPTPLEELYYSYVEGVLTSDALEALVEEYANYVVNYIDEYRDPDEAYRRWVQDTYGMLITC